MTRRWIAVTILVILVVAGCAGKPAAQPATGPNARPAQPSAPRPPGSAGPTGPQPASLVVTADEFARMIRAYQGLPAMVGRASFDVKAKAAALGHDLAVAFAFVRDEIANEIYPGVLRGTSGTLSARAGNDLDKAVLLAAILAEQGRQVRYARCGLDDKVAGDRIGAIFTEPAPSRQSDLTEAAAAALGREGVPEARARDLAQQAARVLLALDESVAHTATADLAIVRDALGRAGIVPAPEADQPALLVEARTHYWLQVQDGGQWLDLDPAFRGAQPGRAFCPASETYAELPDDVYQRVTFRARNEYLEGGTLRSVTVFEHTFPAASLHGQAIVYMNAPSASEAPTGGLAAAPTFVPVLAVGEFVSTGDQFELSGGTMFGQAAEELAGGAPRQLAAQWLDFELTAPGRRSLVSRAIVDTVDPPERAGGSVTATPDTALLAAQLTQPHAIGISTGHLDRLQVIEAAYAHLDADAVGRAFETGVTATAADKTSANIAAVEYSALVASALALASASDRGLTGRWTAAYSHARIFRDQPFIAIVNVSLRRPATGRPIVVGLSLDLRHNVVRVVAEAPRWAEDGFWLNVHHGLVDGAVERRLLSYLIPRRPGAAAPTEAAEALTTSSIFDRAGVQAIPVTAAAGQAAVEVLHQRFAATAGYRLAAEVDEDSVVVLPARPVRVENEDRLGVWVVNRKTGHTLALLDTGLRSAMVERALQEQRSAVKAFVNCVAQSLGPGVCAPLWLAFYKSARVLWWAVVLEGGPAADYVLRNIPQLPWPP